MKNIVEAPQKVKNTVTLLSIYLKKLKTFIHKDTCTPMFVVPLLMVPVHGDNHSVLQ